MGLAVDHAFERILVVAVRQSMAQLPHISVSIFHLLYDVTYWMHELRVPLRRKTGSSFRSISGEIVIRLQVLGDEQFAGELRRRFAIDPLHQRPAFRDIRSVDTANLADVGRHIVAQPVDTVFI